MQAMSTSEDACLEVISCGAGTEPKEDVSDPCACDLDGVVDGIETGRPGCDYHGYSSTFCHVSSACDSTSTSFGGAKTRSCNPLFDNLAATCESCPPGKASSDDGICSPCSEGTFSAVNGSTTCSACPES